VRQGYLWVWGDSSASAAQDSAAKPALLIPNLKEDDTGQTVEGTPVMSAAHRYMRDVPYRQGLFWHPACPADSHREQQLAPTS
jgi:hypothetical protein